MPRRPPVGLAVLALAAACAGPPERDPQTVDVAPVNGVSAATLLACRGFKASLPKELASGVPLRPAAPLSDTTAAWGDPPITLRCGVPRGSERDDPYVFDDVRWAMHDVGAARTWTTLDEKVAAVVTIPDAYSSQAELLGALAKAVSGSLG